jgi:hypothetical protein
LTALLAASLDGVTFSDGTPFDEHDLSSDRVAAAARPTQVPLRWLDYLMAYGPLGVLLIGGLAYLATHSNRWAKRKTSLAGPLAIVLIMIALAIVARVQIARSLEESLARKEQAVTETAPLTGASPLETASAVSPPASRDEGRLTSTMLQIALAVVLLGAAAALTLAAMRRRANARRRQQTPPDFAQPIDVALEELKWGRDAAGVVERCYRDILNIYAQASGVDPATLTPREFAQSLATAGCGGAAMDELTSLFELVHYGGRPDEGFSPRALHCMVQLRDSVPATSPAEA